MTNSKKQELKELSRDAKIALDLATTPEGTKNPSWKLRYLKISPRTLTFLLKRSKITK